MEAQRLGWERGRGSSGGREHGSGLEIREWTVCLCPRAVSVTYAQAGGRATWRQHSFRGYRFRGIASVAS